MYGTRCCPRIDNVQEDVLVSLQCCVSACAAVLGASLYRSACAGGASQRGHQDNVQVNLPCLSLVVVVGRFYVVLFSALEQTHWSKGTSRQCSGKSACPVSFLLMLLVAFM